MTQEHQSVKEMWKDYLMVTDDHIIKANRNYTSWYFCDNEEDANDLAKLVKQGVKRATTGLYNSYKVEGEPLPQVGDFNIITDWQGIAQCIIETKIVSILPFKDVTEEFAEIEGEGDKSLKYWKEVHVEFFTRELLEHKNKFEVSMLVVCQEFETVYK
ncbi:MAG TPA: ASCH domain-containing protein [Desulfosporosinus sp.]|nr:ASCH domain-containing protein [Desulfosporosinus sp.]